jgi:hypothetical protein
VLDQEDRFALRVELEQPVDDQLEQARVDPGRRFVVASLMFSTPEGESFGPMRLVVEFENVAEGTRVRVTQSGIDESGAGAAYRDRLGPGWERMLKDLKVWLEEGRKLPGR